jgi:IS30 family transposase
LWLGLAVDLAIALVVAVASKAQLDQVSLRLNQRPRKTLGFETPASKLQASVASTV